MSEQPTDEEAKGETDSEDDGGYESTSAAATGPETDGDAGTETDTTGTEPESGTDTTDTTATGNADGDTEADTRTGKQRREQTGEPAMASDADTIDRDETDDAEGRAETGDLSSARQGTEVVDADGEAVGLVTAVEDDRIHVDPDPGLTDHIKAELGWGGADEDDTTIEQDRIEEVGHNEIRLSRSGKEELE